MDIQILTVNIETRITGNKKQQETSNDSCHHEKIYSKTKRSSIKGSFQKTTTTDKTGMPVER